MTAGGGDAGGGRRADGDDYERDDHPRQQIPAGAPFDDDGVVEENGGSVPVRVRILSECPLAVARRRGRRIRRRAGLTGERKRRRPSVRRDEFATVYSRDVSLLADMEVFEGQICALHTSSTGCRGDRWAPVILRILPSCYPSPEDEDGDDDNDGGGNNGAESLFVPPCVAASAGLFGFAPRHLNEIGRIRPVRSDRIKTATAGGDYVPCPDPVVRYGARVPRAVRATLREIGAPLPNECARPGGGVLLLAGGTTPSADPAGEKDDGRGRRQEEALRSFFRDGGAGREDRPRLLAEGSVIAVPDRLPGSPFGGDVKPSGSGTRFYEVVRIDAQIKGAGKGHEERNDRDGSGAGERERAAFVPPCYAVSPETELTLQGSSVGALGEPSGARRLPQPSVAENFFRSVLDGTGSSVGRGYVAHCRHPSADRIASHLLSASVGGPSFSPSSAPAAPSDLVLHVIGTEDDYTDECLDAAADIVGMRVLHVDGLAAFAHQYRTAAAIAAAASHDQSESKPSSLPPPVSFSSTGGLADKVAGLGYALDAALSSSPCVLHVSRLDRELTAGGDDDPDARRDEEGRVLACISDALQKSLSSARAHQGGEGRCVVGSEKGEAGSVSWAPPLLVVLSTAAPLHEGGPLSSFLTCESAFVLRPDEAYARELWTEGGDENAAEDDDDAIFKEVKSHLVGRTAAEISYIRQRFSAARRTASGGQSVSGRSAAELTAEIVRGIEDGPSEAAGGSSSSTSKLANALVPDVRWDDVGGLSHVRAEVTDAVELPLRYPHLFRRSGGRSGLLLFGPPGTGKTLVAKAVATECGLPFLSVKGPELLGSYVGESEANVRAAFAAARESAAASAGRRLERGEMAEETTSAGAGGGGKGGAVGGCAILFFDELDSLAPRRGGVGDGGGVMERVVATLLGELDGAAASAGGGGSPATLDLGRPSSTGSVFVIGATNRPDLLDPSLLRPGRFDRLVYLGPARKKEDRVRILMAQTRKFRFTEGVEAETALGRVVDSLPPALSGADLSAISKGALMRSLRRLCEEAEDEAAAATAASEGVGEGGNDDPAEVLNGAPTLSVEDIIFGWDEERLHPVVAVEDFIEASKEVSPSVTEEDLAGYEELRKQFCA